MERLLIAGTKTLDRGTTILMEISYKVLGALLHRVCITERCFFFQGLHIPAHAGGSAW